ncbi:MAG: hypothetical protein HW416_1942 [Chloroflexi bacterium]|nr:hypothetical protein [Chloroflexota bacterium]
MPVGAVDVEHTGPGTLAGRFLRTFWQPVQRSQDLAADRAKPMRIMGENITLYRGEGGPAHAIAFRCAHRGTQLSTGWVEGDDLRCFYHGWKYDANGQCIEQPAEPEPFCQRIKIRAYPTQEYLGLIFAYLGEGDPPAFPLYPYMERQGVLENETYIRPCNYYNNLENDSAHVYFVHRRPGVDWREWNGIPPRFEAEETVWGVTTATIHANGRRTVTHRGIPNMIFRKADQGAGPRPDALEWRVPLDDENHHSFRIGLIPVTGDDEMRKWRERVAALEVQLDLDPCALGERVLVGALQIDEIDKKRTNIVYVEDTLSEVGQGPIADRVNEVLGATDVGVTVLRNIWERELRNLEADRPLKAWSIGDWFESAPGPSLLVEPTAWFGR